MAAALGCVATAGAFVAFETLGDFSILSGKRPIVLPGAARNVENDAAGANDENIEKFVALYEKPSTPKKKTATPDGRKAFLVGADDYDDVSKLSCVKNDLEAFARRLLEIGFEEKNITVLKTGEDRRRREQPTQANIEREFEEFCESLKPGDFAVVFMSGHGIQAENKEAFFAPVDLEPEDPFGTSVSIDKMLARLERSRAKFRWMIVDACRNVPSAWQTSALKARAIGATKGLTAQIAVPESTALLQSCQPGKISYEGGGEVANGFFTLSLLEALDKNDSKADKNGDGVLKFTELIGYVTERTNDLAREHGGEEQTPTFSGSMTDFAILETLIEGLPAQRWREANALFKDAETLGGEGEYAKALEKTRAACEINPYNEEYRKYEKHLANVVKDLEDLKKGAAESERQLEEERKAREEAENRARKAEAERKAQEEEAARKAEAERKAQEEEAERKAREEARRAQEEAERKTKEEAEKAERIRKAQEEKDTLRDEREKTTADWSATSEPGALKSLVIDGITYNFRHCPAGTFRMGDPNGGTRRDVTFERGFWMLETEVTQAMYAKVVGKNPSYYSPNGRRANEVVGLITDDFPVEGVDRYDCAHFIRNLNLKVGERVPSDFKFRLPTEAEWEYACLAGEAESDANISASAWYSGNSRENGGAPRPHKAKTKKPNAWNLCDMRGNVWEWRQDLYENEEIAETAQDAGRPDAALLMTPSRYSGKFGALRGGNAFRDVDECSAYARILYPPTASTGGRGFRFVLACDAAPVPTVPTDSAAETSERATAFRREGGGSRYLEGTRFVWGLEGSPIDRERAFAALKNAAENGRAEACGELAALYTVGGARTPIDFNEAERWARLGSEANDPTARLVLARLYDKGVGGVERDPAQAAKLRDLAFKEFRRLNDLGDVVASFRLAERDFYSGDEWKRRQAVGTLRNLWTGSAKLPAAGRLLGLYETRYAPEQARFGVENLKAASDRGDVEATLALGECYANGRGVKVDAKRAFALYQQAAELGEPRATLALGKCYANGRGVKVDAKRAFALYQQAAELGEPEATLELGKCYANGRGVLRDDGKAVEWIRKAAELGVAEAKDYLRERLGE